MRKHEMVKGVAYIRIAPVKYANGCMDYSYTHEPMAFDGVASNGEFIMHYLGINAEFLGTTPKKMGLEFSDSNWISVDKIKVGVKTSLHRHKGKMIKRVKPTPMGNGKYDTSYIKNAVELVSATRYHLVVFDNQLGKEIILDVRYANPDDWTLV